VPQVLVVLGEGHRLGCNDGDGERELPTGTAAAGGVVERPQVDPEVDNVQAGLLMYLPSQGHVEGFTGIDLVAGQLIDAAHEVVRRTFEQQDPVVVDDDGADDELGDAVPVGFLDQGIIGGVVPDGQVGPSRSLSWSRPACSGPISPRRRSTPFRCSNGSPRLESDPQGGGWPVRAHAVSFDRQPHP
jgi:hypothetical protein